MATIVKAGVLLAVVRLFGRAQLATPMLEIFAVLPLLSIVWGNLAAMRQPSLRRMIAYSSIAHAGYLFYALLGDAAGRLQAVAFYLLAYGLMNLLAFAALPPLPRRRRARPPRQPEGAVPSRPVRGADDRHRHAVARRHPAVPGLRRQVPDLQERHGGGPDHVRGARLVGSYLGIYFYLRLIQFMFMSPDAQVAGAAPRRGLALAASAACLAGAVLIAVFRAG
jgi:NADH-quinone oxidoreductase subunit N